MQASPSSSMPTNWGKNIFLYGAGFVHRGGAFVTLKQEKDKTKKCCHDVGNTLFCLRRKKKKDGNYGKS